MKKFRRILALAVLLAVSLMTLAIAEEKSEILIDSARNAAIKFKASESADGVTGTFNFAGDVVKGLMTGNVDLKFKEEVAKQLGDMQGALYYSLTDLMEVVGNLDMPVPAEMSKEVSKLNANMESVASGSTAYAKGDINLEGKSKEAVPTINVDVSAKGSSKDFDGKVTFDVDAGPSAGQAPFKSIEFGISEQDASTTISLGAAVDAAGPYAQQLKMIGKEPDKVKQGITQQLAGAGITVEKVEVGEYKEEAGTASTKLSITLKGWRDVIKKNVGMMAGGKFDSQKLTDSVTKMLEAKFDSITFTLKVENKVFKGELAAKVTNMRQLALGYYELASMITESQLKDDSEEPGKRFVLAYQTVAMAEAQRAIQCMIDADMGFDGKGKLKVSGEGPDKMTLKVVGDFNGDFSNYAAYTTKAAAAGLPSAKNAAFKFVLGMSDKARLTGTLYAYTDANFIEYYKKVLISVSKKAGAPAEAVATAEKVQFKSAGGSFTLNKDGIKGSNFLESGDLSPLSQVAVGAASGGKFSGDVVGFSIAGKGEGEKMNFDGMINFSKFMPGKTADQVKEALSAPSTLVVKEGAKAEEVQLLAVTKTEISMPDTLKAVAADGKSLVGATNPVASLGGGGGGNSMLYILGGLAALGVVGVGVAAGRKKG